MASESPPDQELGRAGGLDVPFGRSWCSSLVRLTRKIPHLRAFPLLFSFLPSLPCKYRPWFAVRRLHWTNDTSTVVILVAFPSSDPYSSSTQYWNKTPLRPLPLHVHIGRRISHPLRGLDSFSSTKLLSHFDTQMICPPFLTKESHANMRHFQQTLATLPLCPTRWTASDVKTNAPKAEFWPLNPLNLTEENLSTHPYSDNLLLLRMWL